MSRNSEVVAASSRTFPAARSRFVHAGLGLAILTSLTAFSGRAEAQTAEHRPVELRPFVGAFVPTGDHRDLLKGAALVGAQVAYSFTPNVALAGTFGWAPSKDKLALASTKLDLFQYDLGVEGRLSNLTPSSDVLMQPYAALGVGGRTYHYRDLKSAASQTNFLGYGAIGLDVVSKALRGSTRRRSDGASRALRVSVAKAPPPSAGEHPGGGKRTGIRSPLLGAPALPIVAGSPALSGRGSSRRSTTSHKALKKNIDYAARRALRHSRKSPRT
jgi:hypothetical protein